MDYDSSGGPASNASPSFVDPETIGADVESSDSVSDQELVMAQLQVIENHVHGLLSTHRIVVNRLSSFSDSLKSIKEFQEVTLRELDTQLKAAQKSVDKIAHVVSDLNLGDTSASLSDRQEVTESFAKVVRKLFFEITRQAFLCRLGNFEFSINRLVLVNLIFSLCFLVYLGIFSFATTVRLNRLEYRLYHLTEQLKPRPQPR